MRHTNAPICPEIYSMCYISGESEIPHYNFEHVVTDTNEHKFPTFSIIITCKEKIITCSAAQMYGNSDFDVQQLPKIN